MKQIKILIAAILGFATYAQAKTVTIDFDDLIGGPIYEGEVVTSQYQSKGVTFSDSFEGGVHANNTIASFVAGSTAPNVLWVDLGGGNRLNQYLQVDFVHPVNLVQATVGAPTGTTFTIEAYGTAGLLSSNSYDFATESEAFLPKLATVEANAIAFVRMYANFKDAELGKASLNFAIDNLTIQAVPEPSTFALLFLGASFGLIFKQRRKPVAR